MGIHVRRGGYTKKVHFGKRTVKEGEAMAIWNREGKHRQVIGPALCHLFFSTIMFLDRFVAEQNQYMLIENQDGTRCIMKGPCVLFKNPVYHQNITIQNAVQLESKGQCCIVTRCKGDSLSKRVEFGPAIVFPLDAQETITSFTFSSPSSDLTTKDSFPVLTLRNNRYRFPVPVRNNFTILLAVTVSFQDPLICVSHDMVSILNDALKADANLLTQYTIDTIHDSLQNLPVNFPHLLQSASTWQLTIDAVAILSTKRNAIQESIREKTLESEATAEAQQKIAEMNLESENKRALKKHEFEMAEVARHIAVRREQAVFEAELRKDSVKGLIELLKTVKELGVDPTKFACTSLLTAGEDLAAAVSLSAKGNHVSGIID